MTLLCVFNIVQMQFVFRVLSQRLGTFSLELEPNKRRLVEFGRFAKQNAKRRERKLETIYFLGFTHYGTFNRKGNYRVGRKTEKGRHRRSLVNSRSLMQTIRHDSLYNSHVKLTKSCAVIMPITV